jgi:hypothetical protein
MQITLNLEPKPELHILQFAQADGAKLHAATANVSSTPQNVWLFWVTTCDEPRARTTGVKELADDLGASVASSSQFRINFFGNEFHRVSV